MNWFFIALAAPFLWALVNLADKYLVTKYPGRETKSGSLVLFSSLIGVVAAFVIGIFARGIFAISLLDKALLVFIGAFSICWMVFYLLTLEIEDVSATIPWMLTIPIFGFVLSYFFLGEKLNRYQLLGFIIILLGAIILSVDFSKVRLLFKKKIALYMLLSSLITAINGVIFKFVAVKNNFWVASFWQYLGLGLSGIFIFLFLGGYRRDFITNIEKNGSFILFLNIASELVNIVANLCTNFALLLAPVALVYMVGSFQPVAVLLLTFLSTKFIPKILKEDFSLKNLLPKLIAIAIMLIGGIVLFL